MTTVSTPQTPDLLLSMLMGMVGSAPSSTPASTSALSDSSGGSLFSDILDATAGASLEPGELELAIPDSTKELDSLFGPGSEAGQLNALIAASLGTAPTLPSKPIATKSEEAAGEKLGSSEFTANPVFAPESRLLGTDSSRGEQGLNSRGLFQSQVGEVPSAAQLQSETSGPQRAQRTDPRQQSDVASATQGAGVGNVGNSVATGSETQLESAFDGNLDANGNSALGNAAQINSAEVASFQNDSATVGPETGKDNHPSRAAKSRSLKDNDRDSDNSFFSNSAIGAFGSLADNPVVTAINGGSQSRQDGILGRGEAQEQFAAAISSRESSSESPQLTNPETGQPIDLNSLRADFEQSLDRVAENFPLDSVAQQIVEVAEPDSGWISIEIQPPNLGKLEIMVSKQGDEYAAQIIAHDPSTEEALSLQQAELLEALNQHGLELKEVQIISDTDSSNRWNLDSSRQDQQDSQSRGEFSGERREDTQRDFPPQNQPSQTPKVLTQVAGRQQVNLLV